jgi:hypothetical protein
MSKARDLLSSLIEQKLTREDLSKQIQDTLKKMNSWKQVGEVELKPTAAGTDRFHVSIKVEYFVPFQLVHLTKDSLFDGMMWVKGKVILLFEVK